MKLRPLCPARIPVFWSVLLAAAACHRPAEPSEPSAALGPGVAARVGTDVIPTDTVRRIAAGGHGSLAEARDRAVFDAVLAAGARERFGPLVAHHAERTAVTRALLEAFAAEAAAAGPPTDAELAKVTEARWWELDRPPLRRATHAVVPIKLEAEEKPARALAERIATAVASATDAGSFRALASAVPVSAPLAPAASPSAALSVKVEDLDPVAADGRTFDPAHPPPPGGSGGHFSPAFAAAVFTIPGVGRVSSVVRTEFGYHVILLTEILPPLQIQAEERRRSLLPEVRQARAAALQRAALDSARARAPVAVERAASELTEQVRVSP